MKMNENKIEESEKLERKAREMAKKLCKLLDELYKEDHEAMSIMLDAFVSFHLENRMKMSMEYIQAMIEKEKSGRLH